MVRLDMNDYRRAGQSDFSPMPECSVSHCSRPRNSRKGKYCDAHYQISYRGKDPEQRILRDSGDARHIYDLKCWVSDCPRRANQKGLCTSHIRAAKQGVINVPDSLGVELNPMCSFEGCQNRAHSRSSGLCHAHSDQLRRGVPLKTLTHHGTYALGDHPCLVDGCNSPAVAKHLCPRHISMVNTYGITPEYLSELFNDPICSNPGCRNTERLHIDHDHKTGKVRGLLCARCNTSLGMLKEDVERIRGLAEYKLLHSGTSASVQ